MIVVKHIRGSTYMAIFTKTLSSSDIEWRLTIPGDCAAEFPPFHRDQHIEFNVKDESGHQWTFRCARQSATNSGIVIISGWHQFVAKRKNLECISSFCPSSLAPVGLLLFKRKVFKLAIKSSSLSTKMKLVVHGNTKLTTIADYDLSIEMNKP
ncbi:hypothetical protein EZV62_019029 [Acer yangbiense]|uniref:TF-B3 domain-containing protein n=1 Tax=Acer yangbiense TaxID=1000413 RepID=A0A5C7H9F1_9ROSI|nr:hypothetical protein EZV62_019029 [Acer yangbiense]